MRMSRLFSQTLRENPADAEMESHRLLLRAGYIRPLGTGIFTALPLGLRAMRRIENSLRQEMEAIGGQEIRLPLVQPAELWQQSGRHSLAGAELTRFQDRSARPLILAVSYAEAAADLARRQVQSYRQLPLLVFQVQTRWRDDPHPRAGLLCLREFAALDSFSFAADQDGLEEQCASHLQAFRRIFDRCALPVRLVDAASHMPGALTAQEFMYLTPHGDDTLLICDSCGAAANRQAARFRKPPASPAQPLPLEKVATPNVKTIDDLAAFLSIPPAKTAKAVLLMASIPKENTVTEQFVFAVVRGDMELNEDKLARALGALALRPAAEEEIRAAGAVPGYASPRGLRGVFVAVDEAAASSPNLVAGANEEGYHLLNVNFGRDYAADLVADLAAARQGDACPHCGAPLREARGAAVAKTVQVGTHFTQKMNCVYRDPAGQERPLVMGLYSLGIDRLLACIAEEHHDERGLALPPAAAPFDVHLVLLPARGQDAGQTRAAEDLYASLQSAGLHVLFDDREESPGVKFNDADLIGLPLRLTLSERSLQQGGVEWKRRREAERSLVPLDAVLAACRKEILRQTASADA